MMHSLKIVKIGGHILDDSKAKNDWGWKPKFGLDSSIKKSLNN